jgi:tetratricopeptide (TPR) repeat protein
MPSDTSRNPAQSSRPADNSKQAGNSRIESWKEIAAFFGRDERTVKRWEKSRRLPVHRLPGEKGGVFAYKLELTTWLDSAGEKLQSEAEAAEPATDQANTFLPDSSQIPGSTSSPILSQNSAQPQPDIPAPLLLQGAANQDSAPRAAMLATEPAGRAQRRNARSFLLAAISIVAVGVVLYPAFRRSAGHSMPKIASSTPAAPPGNTPASRPVVDLAARELYLKGRYYWNHRTDASLKLAVEAFTQAVVRDPQYAPAYAGLADTYNLMTQYSYMPHAQAFPLALAAARKAVALDDSLSEAHRALAFGLFYWEWQTTDAFREYQRAIDLDPKDVEAHNWYATSLLIANELPRAAEQIEKARELDPTSRIVLANQALILANAGEVSAAVARLKEIESAEPDFLAPPQYLAEIYFANRNYPEYLAQLQRLADTSHDPEKKALALAASHGWSRSGSRGLLQSLRAIDRASFEAGKSSSYDLAHVCAMLGDKPAADKYLKAAVDANDFNAMQALYGDFNQAMRGDPEFEQIKHQIALRMKRSTAVVAGSQP